MQIDVIEEVKGTQYLQCKLYIDGNASVSNMLPIDIHGEFIINERIIKEE